MPKALEVLDPSLGMSMLAFACEKGDFRIVDTLIQIFRADVESRAVDGETPLIKAARCGHVEVVDYLITNGASMVSKDSLGWTPLHTACSEGHINVVKLLLDRGADKEAEDNEGWTPLHVACCM